MSIVPAPQRSQLCLLVPARLGQVAAEFREETVPRGASCPCALAAPTRVVVFDGPEGGHSAVPTAAAYPEARMPCTHPLRYEGPALVSRAASCPAWHLVLAFAPTLEVRNVRNALRARYDVCDADAPAGGCWCHAVIACADTEAAAGELLAAALAPPWKQRFATAAGTALAPRFHCVVTGGGGGRCVSVTPVV